MFIVFIRYIRTIFFIFLAHLKKCKNRKTMIEKCCYIHHEYYRVYGVLYCRNLSKSAQILGWLPLHTGAYQLGGGGGGAGGPGPPIIFLIFVLQNVTKLVLHFTFAAISIYAGNKSWSIYELPPDCALLFSLVFTLVLN